MIKELADYLEDFGIRLAYALAGGFGVVAMLSKPNELTMYQKFIRFIVGVASSVYITPLANYYLGFPDRLGFGVAFLVGYSGLKSFEVIIKKLTDKFGKNEINW